MIVAPVNGTPFTLTVAGLMSVSGMNAVGEEFLELKTKICRLAGVVALMLNGPNAWPTPI